MCATKLKNHALENFALGYNSYLQSKSMVEDREIPYGFNVVLNDVGSATKRSGYLAYGGEIVAGHTPKGAAHYVTDTKNEVIVACNTGWYRKNGSSWDLIPGKTFSADKDTYFIQAMGRLYGANGTDNLCYYDGTSITEVSPTYGGVFKRLAFFAYRLWGISATDSDRLYWSNTIAADGTMGDFGTFDVNLSASPIPKNAGWLEIVPGAGIKLKNIYTDSDAGSEFIYVESDRRVDRFSATATKNTDNSLIWPQGNITPDIGALSPFGSVKVGNDRWFYTGDSISSRGEVAQYQNIRTQNKSGRINSEISSIPPSGRGSVALGYWKDKVYIAHKVGSYNDKVEVYDVKLNAWGTPLTGLNIHSFLSVTESDGTKRFLGLSSNESYVLELETGLDDNGTAIAAEFETKATDCKLPGVVKRFAFIDVFYSTVYGTLTYEVFLDEVSSITGSVRLGNSQDKPVGIGSLPIGSFVIGEEYDPSTTFATLQQNSSFRIYCDYNPGKTISVRFGNANLGEQFRINGIVVNFLPGSIYET